MKRSKHVADVLLDPEGPLAALHQRVMEAGCEVDPDWSPLYALFVPITETQMDELIGLADDGSLGQCCCLFFTQHLSSTHIWC